MTNKSDNGSKLQGLTRLLTDTTIGITDIVEDMHKRVVHPPFLPSTSIQNLITQIAGITYNNIRLGTKIIGGGLDKALGKLAPLLGELKSTTQREAISAALNGVVGDYLEEKNNPLKISMQLRHQSKAIVLDPNGLNNTYPNINGKVLLMVHGSCMNDLQWTRNEHNHAYQLAKDLALTPVFLRYNSGLHISTNGQKLNSLLEKLILNWPVPLKQLTLISHSMGGLVTRSAIHYGQKEGSSWIQHLKKTVFLGTPHHGAPLERIGSYFDVILESIPYSKPFTRLSKIRSAGVTDLRYGNLVDEDWQYDDRFKLKKDIRQNIVLPKDIEFYNIAAVLKKETDSSYARMLGDNLVNLKSALGQHKDPDKKLNFKDEHTYVNYECSHLDLLNEPKVYAKIKSWLK